MCLLKILWSKSARCKKDQFDLREFLLTNVCDKGYIKRRLFGHTQVFLPALAQSLHKVCWLKFAFIFTVN